MLILRDSKDNEIKAYKSKDMSTESYSHSMHKTKSGTIDNKSIKFHCYNYGDKFYFKNKENKRWYCVMPKQIDTYNYDLHFKLVKKIRE